MDTGSQKRIAARIMKCGVSRVRIKPSEEVEEALTREDIRGLIQKGLVWSVRKKGTSKFASKKKLEQKRKGRMRGPGRRKGTKGARKNDKTKWMEKVRPLRRLLAELRESGQIGRQDYGVLYRRVKGGFFRNRKHLLYYLKEHDMLMRAVKDVPGKVRVGKAAGKIAKNVVKRIPGKGPAKKIPQKKPVKAAKSSKKPGVKKKAGK